MRIEHSLLGGAVFSLSTRRVGDCEEAIRPSDYTRYSIWIWPESTAHCREVGGRVAVVKDEYTGLCKDNVFDNN